MMLIVGIGAITRMGSSSSEATLTWRSVSAQSGTAVKFSSICNENRPTAALIMADDHLAVVAARDYCFRCLRCCAVCH